MIPENAFAYPGLKFFTWGNPYTGSVQGMNYKLQPQTDKETEEKTLLVTVWYGELCSALSQPEAQTVLPLTAEGVEESRVYLREQYAAFCKKSKADMK